MTDHLAIGILLLTVPGILFLLAGSPVRILILAFSLQIVFTIGQLRAMHIFIFRADDLLMLLLLWLWLLSLPDRSMKGIKIGVQGVFIICFLILISIAAFRGISAGRSQLALIDQIKTFGGYFFYFPLLWILSDKEHSKWLWKALLISTIVGSIIYTIKGYIGYGENVLIRETTGIRIATRQPNAYAVVMLMFIGRLWKDWKNRPAIILVVPSLIFMGSAIILSQTRGVWGGVLLAFSSVWILNLFRKKDGKAIGRKLVASLTVLAALVILVVFSVSISGIVSTSDIARRTGTDSGSYITDVSTLSRIIAWSAIIEELHGSSMIVGKGFGAVYTCYRPDIGAVVTLYYVDSSYFLVALDMGIIGVLILLGIFVTTAVRAARLFVRTDNQLRAGISLGIFGAVIMLLFASGFAATLTSYRYTVLWVFLPALLQSEIVREEKCQTPAPVN